MALKKFLKNFLANHYNFVMMRGAYEKHLVFLWSSATMAASADCMCRLNVSRSQSLPLRPGSEPRGNRRDWGGSPQCVRRASRAFPQPLFQHGECVRSATLVIFLRRAF